MARFHRRYRLPRRTRICLRAALCVIVLLFGYLFFDSRLEPVFRTYAAYMAKSIAVRRLNDAVGQTLKNDPVSCDELMTYQKNDDGEIIAVQANAVKINTLKYEITRGVLNNLNELPGKKFTVPLGNVMGGAAFTGRGPALTLCFSPVEDVDSSVSSKFTSAGINQTKEDIYLTVKADVTAMLSGSGTTVHVKNDFLIAESVVVGTVPSQYFDMNGSSGSSAGSAYLYGNTGSSAASSAHKK